MPETAAGDLRAGEIEMLKVGPAPQAPKAIIADLRACEIEILKVG